MRNIILATAILSCVAACGAPAPYSAQASTTCDAGCQPGTLRIRTDITTGEMVSHRW
jgi:hypothetical protein